MAVTDAGTDVRRPAATWPGPALLRSLPADRIVGWLGPLAVTALAGWLRFARLGEPGGKVFDEVYYARDAWRLLRHGVELNVAGNGPGFVVHPPLGKWMIAFGEWVFGNDAYGWRFSAAVVGTLAVLVLARTARRMFGSTLLGCVAGLLLALDGLTFVQSRIAMLDGFLMFWLVAAFGCLVVDRDDGLRRVCLRVGGRRAMRRGPRLGVRWWRVGAGVCLGAALATKWSALFYFPVAVLLAFGWDVGARRAGGVERPWRAALRRDGAGLLAGFVVVPAAVYVASWTGWFLADGTTAWGHDTYVVAGQSVLAHGWAVLRGWVGYQIQQLTFHTGLDKPHPYKSTPWTWLLLGRPVAYYYTTPPPSACAAATCSREVLGVGNPALWWASALALVWVGWGWVARRDWRGPLILAGFAAGYLPWFAFPDRTMFLFYALPSVPFMALAVAWAAGRVLGGVGATRRRRAWSAGVVGGYLVVVAAVFFWLYPVLSAQVIPYQEWRSRMLFTNCTNDNKAVETAPCWI